MVRYRVWSQAQYVEDLHHRYAVTAHASRGRNPHWTLGCRAPHNLEKCKPGARRTQTGRRPEQPDRHQPRGRRRDLRSDEGRGEVLLRWRSHQARVERACTEEAAGITSEVSMPATKHIIVSPTVMSPTHYARSDDFCRIFYEEADRLFRLSLLLSAAGGGMGLQREGSLCGNWEMRGNFTLSDRSASA